ncbi:MAG TPA: ABC transporter substrate-binding protein [Stellaceae bacterium]|nr:ABC transporter substrate-binding protein [Stellaceae bacterium]
MTGSGIALCVVAALSTTTIAAAEDTTPIKIGLSQIASGVAADYWSRQVNKPALLAIDDANKNGGVNGRKVVGILEDNQGLATTGAAVAHKLIEIDHVNMIFVAPTPAVLATLPIAETAEVPVISTSISPKVAQSPWGALAQPPADRQGEAYAKFVIAHHFQRVADLTGQSDSDTIASNAFKSALTKAGIKIVDAETYEVNAQDFTAQLTKIRASNPDCFLIQSLSGATYGFILKQMAQLGFRPPTILTYYQIADPQTRKLAGDLVDGVYFIEIPVDPEWNARVFRPRMGYDADGNGALAYDAIALYLDAYAKSGTDDPKKIRETMLNYQGYKGAVGAWGYNGQPVTQVQYRVSRMKPGGGTEVVP